MLEKDLGSFRTSKLTEADADQVLEKKYIISRLNKWLALPDASDSINTKKHKKILIAVGILTLIAIAPVYLYKILFYLPALGIGFLIASLINFSFKANSNYAVKIGIEEELSGIMEGRASWERNVVIENLNSLIEQEKEASFNGKEISRLENLKENYAEELQRKEEEIEQLIEQFGGNKGYKYISSYSGNIVAHDLLKIIDNYRNEFLALGKLNVKLTGYREAYSSILNTISEFLNLKSKEDVKIEALEVKINQLNNDVIRYNNLRKELGVQEDYYNKMQKQLKFISNKKVDLLKKLKLQSSENPELDLTRALEILPVFKKLQNELFSLECSLKNYDEIRQTIEEKNIIKEELPSLKEKLEKQIEKHDEIIKKRQQIETNIKYAEKEQKITACIQQSHEAKSQLNDKMNLFMLKLASRFVAEKVEKQYESNNQPEVLKNAVKLFNKFTRNQYKLLISNQNEVISFNVFDSNNEKSLLLNELSDGTRIQLFLAVRLAFIKSIEKKSNVLPIFFDEALSITDHARFLEIAETLFIIAKEDNRQVFYLTSDQHDVQKWQSMADKYTERPFSVFDLAEIRKIASSVDLKTLQDFKVEEILNPHNMKPEEYAVRLQIPKFDAFENINNCHLFYILQDNLQILYALMSKIKICKIGELCNLIAADESIIKELLAEANYNLISLRAICIKVYCKNWRKGRSKPLKEFSVFNELTINPKQLEAIKSVLKDNNNNVEAFITTLENSTDKRLKGFRQNKKNEIIDLLTEHDYITDEKILDRQHIVSATFQEVKNAEKVQDLAKMDIFTEIEAVSSLFVDFE